MLLRDYKLSYVQSEIQKQEVCMFVVITKGAKTLQIAAALQM